MGTVGIRSLGAQIPGRLTFISAKDLEAESAEINSRL
jgi:hypothetical protein